MFYSLAAAQDCHLLIHGDSKDYIIPIPTDNPLQRGGGVYNQELLAVKRGGVIKLKILGGSEASIFFVCA